MLIVIAGPTAVGKSELAVKLAAALNGEIISADSMQIYKGLDIGTAKASVAEQCGIKHHLIDILECGGEYSVNQFISDAKIAIAEIEKNNKQPILCGGTGFFVRALLYGYNLSLTPKSAETREKYNALLSEHGALYLHKLLEERDIALAGKLHANDVKRVIRALEILDGGGVKEERNTELKFPAKIYILNCDRQKLYSRINSRVDKMLSNGLIDEVKNLCNAGLTCESQAMQSIGYKEVLMHLNNEISLNETAELIKKNTRNYAKRQLTFFRGFKSAVWLDTDDGLHAAYERIIAENS